MTYRTLLIAFAAAILTVACTPPEERAADYIAKAQKYYDAGDYVKARLEAQNAAQVEPKNARARYLLALVAEQEADIRVMFGHLGMAVDSDPSNVDARLKLGSLYFLGQAWELADEQVQALLELAPDDARVRLLNARLLVQKGERAEGIAEIDHSLELDPDFVEAILLKAAAEAIEDLDQGLATLDAAIARFPPDEVRQLRELRIVMLAQDKQIDAVEQGLSDLSRDFPAEEAYHFQLARFYTSQGRVDDADRLLQQITQLDPTDQETRLGYVQFLATQRDVEKAEAALKAFIDESPDSGRLRLALGELYEATKRLPEAREAYQGLVARSPKSEDGVAARLRLAALDLQANDVAAGSKAVDDILRDVPDQPTALLMRAGVHFVEKRFDEAIADLRGVLRKTPDEARALLLLAQTYVQKDDLTMAKDSYRRLLEVDRNSADGLIQLAGLHAATREFSEAEALLRRRVEAQPDDVIASGRLVEVLMAQDKTAEAEKEARRMSALTNDTGVGDFSLGRVLAQKKDYDAAAEAFRRSVNERAGDPLPLEGLVRSLLAAGKQQEAIQTLNAQLENEGSKLFAKYLLGGLYGQAGNQQEAEKYLEDVIRERPDAMQAYLSLAATYKDDRDARIKVYQRGLKAIPGNPQMSLMLGTELEQGGRIDEAVIVYEELVKGSPDFEPGINNLAALLLDHRKDQASHARALELAKRLVRSENPAIQDTLGWAYYRVGQYPEAIETLERVVARADVPIFNYHLGMAYLAAGNEVSARQQLELAVTAQTTYIGLDEARATLARLKTAG